MFPVVVPWFRRTRPSTPARQPAFHFLFGSRNARKLTKRPCSPLSSMSFLFSKSRNGTDYISQVRENASGRWTEATRKGKTKGSLAYSSDAPADEPSFMLFAIEMGKSSIFCVQAPLTMVQFAIRCAVQLMQGGAVRLSCLGDVSTLRIYPPRNVPRRERSTIPNLQALHQPS